MRVADCKTFGPINKRLEGVSVIMRSEQFKTVTDRELAEQYLAMAEEDKASVEKEIIDRFVADKAKPRTAKAAAKNMIPVIIALYLGGLLGRLLSEYTGSIGDLLFYSIGTLIGALIATVIMMIYTVIKNRKKKQNE